MLVETVLAPSVPPVMVIVTLVAWVFWADPVTVMTKFSEGLCVVVDTVKVEVLVPPEVRVTLEGLNDAVTPVAAGGTEDVRSTVPESPRLVTDTVKVAEPPATMPAVVGDALMVKSFEACTFGRVPAPNTTANTAKATINADVNFDIKTRITEDYTNSVIGRFRPLIALSAGLALEIECRPLIPFFPVSVY